MESKKKTKPSLEQIKIISLVVECINKYENSLENYISEKDLIKRINKELKYLDIKLTSDEIKEIFKILIQSGIIFYVKKGYLKKVNPINQKVNPSELFKTAYKKEWIDRKNNIYYTTSKIVPGPKATKEIKEGIKMLNKNSLFNNLSDLDSNLHLALEILKNNSKYKEKELKYLIKKAINEEEKIYDKLSKINNLI